MKAGPIDIKRGPRAGYTVTAEAFRLPSGDWCVELLGVPTDKPDSIPSVWKCGVFPTCTPAYHAVREIGRSMAAMSKPEAG